MALYSTTVQLHQHTYSIIFQTTVDQGFSLKPDLYWCEAHNIAYSTT
jgi:hypothetical protein